MKTIGFLYGFDSEFTMSLLDSINENYNEIQAELINIGGLSINQKINYDVIFDRVSYDVPFFDSYIKLAKNQGVKVINSEIMNSPEDYFFYYTKAESLKMKVPRTVILPSKHHPPGTNADFMQNLSYPLNWEEIFEYVKFPAIIKPNKYNVFANTHIIYNPREFFSIYDLTGSDLMLLQEYIDYDEYYRVYSIGKQFQRIMEYVPSLQLKSRFTDGEALIDAKLAKKLKTDINKFNKSFSIDFNAVEVAVKDGVPYYTEFINIDPYSSQEILKPNNYKWLVDSFSEYLKILLSK